MLPCWNKSFPMPLPLRVPPARSRPPVICWGAGRRPDPRAFFCPLALQCKVDAKVREDVRMKVLRADAMGLCFGVRDALAIAANLPDAVRTTIHGELVHNETVLVHLQSRGFRITAEADRDALPTTEDVLVTAHGISDRERARLESAGKRLIDTTCPLVRRVHRAAQALAADGFLVVVLGRRVHVEGLRIVWDLI